MAKLKDAHKPWFSGGVHAKVSKDGTFPLKAPPELPAGKEYTPLSDEDLDKCLALTHGMSGAYAGAALKTGRLLSGMRRLGPDSSDYGRQADAQGGGACSVYTRAIFSIMKDWPASGAGVGSSEGRVQLLVDPLGVLKDDNSWHVSGTDCMGCPPSGNKTQGLALSWAAQSRYGRAYLFRHMSTHAGDAKNNELMHWDSLPLENRLIAVVHAGSAEDASFKTFLESTTGGVTHCEAWVGKVMSATPRWEIQVGPGGGYVPVYQFDEPTQNIKAFLASIQTARRTG